MKTDSELLQCWAEFQDQGAFTEVVRRYGGLVVATALRRCAHRRDLVDEASQRVFAAAARKATKLVSVPSLSAWLHRATVLECTHLARREAIYSKKLASLANQPQPMKFLSNAAESHAAAELLEALDESLLRLRERDREILMLRHVQGMSYREIAAVLRKNEAAVQRQGSRALEALTTRMKTRYATLTAVTVGAQLSHGLALTAIPVSLESLSALARALSASTGATGALALWLASASRAKVLVAGTAILTVLVVGVYLWMTSGTHADTPAGDSQATATTQKRELSGASSAVAADGETKVETSLTDEERERLIAAERLLAASFAKNVYQVYQALFAYASSHDQTFPNPPDRNANAALRELFRVGMIDDEKLFAMIGTNTKVDGDIGSAADEYAKALGPNENSMSYVAGLASDRDSSILPILRVDYIGKSGIHFVIVARIGGNVKVYETTDGIVMDLYGGKQCDIFSKAYGTTPENILSPVITATEPDKDWEKVLDLAVHDPESARDLCLQPQEGKEKWLFNAAELVFGNMPVANFEESLAKIQAVKNERQREALQRAIGSNFVNYYSVDRQAWPEVDRLFRMQCQTDNSWYGVTKGIIENRLKQESAPQTAAWLETLPPDSIASLVSSVASKFAAEDPRAAADWYVKISSAATDVQPADVLRQAVSLWQDKPREGGDADWAAASEWLLLQNQSHANQAKGTLAKEWFKVGETEAALRWAESITEPYLRKQIVQGAGETNREPEAIADQTSGPVRQ